MFELHFVQTELVLKEDERFFSDLYDRRQTGDYDDLIIYDKVTVIQLFSQTDEFVDNMIKLIKNKN